VVKAFLGCLFSTGAELEAKVARIEGHSVEHIDLETFNVDLHVLGKAEFLRQMVERGNRHFKRVGPASRVRNLATLPSSRRPSKKLAESGRAAHVEDHCSGRVGDSLEDRVDVAGAGERLEPGLSVGLHGHHACALIGVHCGVFAQVCAHVEYHIAD